jgi:hypothetical protein
MQEQQLRKTVKRFRGGLAFTAYRLLYHSTLGPRLTNKPPGVRMAMRIRDKKGKLVRI